MNLAFTPFKKGELKAMTPSLHSRQNATPFKKGE